MSSYRIADEPAPSALAKWAVNPVFPFLAVMLGGTWIGFAWFAFNSFAVGSPTRSREILWLVVGLVSAGLLVVAMLAGVGAGWLRTDHVRYAALVVLVVKLSAAYATHILQSRTIEIYEYYGGVLHNGLPILLVAFLVGRRTLEPLPTLLELTLQ